MKLILLSVFISAIWNVSHAATLAEPQTSALVIDNASKISFSGYNGQPATVTSTQSRGFWGALVATTTGIFTATYLGNESGYVNSYHFGTGSGALLESNNLGATVSQSVGAGLLNFSFSDNAGLGHTFANGDQQQKIFGFAILKGQTNKYGTFDYLLGFNDSYSGDADYDDFVVGINFTSIAPVPEPQIYAMILAGLGLLGFSARRRKSENFD